eukprot:9742765-Lingulodinium_polyedra.AAC.1
MDMSDDGLVVGTIIRPRLGVEDGRVKAGRRRGRRAGAQDMHAPSLRPESLGAACYEVWQGEGLIKSGEPQGNQVFCQ